MSERMAHLILFRTGEYRMRQTTVEAPRGGALSGSPGSDSSSGFATAHQTLEPRALPLEAPNHDPSSDLAQHSTLPPSEEALHRAESGVKMQPKPQRDRGDMVPYTKRVSRRTCLTHITHSRRLGSSWILVLGKTLKRQF